MDPVRAQLKYVKLLSKMDEGKRMELQRNLVRAVTPDSRRSPEHAHAGAPSAKPDETSR